MLVESAKSVVNRVVAITRATFPAISVIHVDAIRKDVKAPYGFIAYSFEALEEAGFGGVWQTELKVEITIVQKIEAGTAPGMAKLDDMAALAVALKAEALPFAGAASMVSFDNFDTSEFDEANVDQYEFTVTARFLIHDRFDGD